MVRKVLVGLLTLDYEIGFNRYFYRPQPTRTTAEIRADTLVLEREMNRLLNEIIEGDKL